jgi:aerobic C4-dicarboxylate transport protein
MGFIPKTFIGALADGEVPQVLLISILSGFAIARMGELGKRALNAIDIANKVVFGIVRIVVRAAPLGALGGMAFTVGSYGVASLTNLLKLMGTFYLSSVLFVVVVLGAIAQLTGFSIFRFLAYIKDELLIVLPLMVGAAVSAIAWWERRAVRVLVPAKARRSAIAA